MRYEVIWKDKTGGDTHYTDVNASNAKSAAMKVKNMRKTFDYLVGVSKI